MYTQSLESYLFFVPPCIILESEFCFVLLFIVWLTCRVMKKSWQTRQRSVGCISPHAWKLPLVMAVCILVYSLPLSLAVSVEPPSEPREMITWTMTKKLHPKMKIKGPQK